VILVDTSVWIDHLRQSDPHLVDLLNGSLVLVHPFVVGELALGNLRDRDVLGILGTMPQAIVAAPDEVLQFIAVHRLAGLGIGYVDAHLLASVRLMPGTALWTRDKRLSAAAARDGVPRPMPD
jgi:predicted nucleic acid-binding protein